MSDLADRWPIPALHDVRDALLVAWDRDGYHDLRHLAEVLDRIDELDRAGERFDRVPVVLAAWFHDAVYDALPDAEERSAQWAGRALPEPPSSGRWVSVSRTRRATSATTPAGTPAAGSSSSAITAERSSASRSPS